LILASVSILTLPHFFASSPKVNPTPTLSTATASTSVSFHPPAMHNGGIYAGPPVKLLLVGDSTAFTLGIGLGAYKKDYNIEWYNRGTLGCGVAQGTEFQLHGVVYPVNSLCSGNKDKEQWSQAWRDEIQTIHPNVVMILAGRLEVVNRTYDGRWTDILQPGFAAYVNRQLTFAVDIASSGGARVILLTAPCYDTGEQPDGRPWPEDSRQRLAKYNQILGSVAASTRNVTLFDFNDLVCPDGHYQSHIDGYDVRYDGVHFTLGGGVVFEPELFPLAERLGREQMSAK
jgi:hypothetical protein